jgi:hypothetical protein
MDIDDLLLRIYCLVDDEIKDWKPRARGPSPTLRDSEVITLEVVGEWLGLDQDRRLLRFFRRYHLAEFPALGRIHRTTFVRQAANLWRAVAEVTRLLSRELLELDCAFWILDSVSLPVCRLARADRCRRFEGLAHCGREQDEGGFYYGFRLHLRVSPEGVIGQIGLAPAHVSDLAMTEELLPPGGGLCLGDRNYWSPRQQQALAQRGWQLVAPFRRRKQDPTPERSRALARLRQRVETTIGQLTERYHLKRTWARDLWHLSHRLLRKVLSHALMVWLNVQAEITPLHLAQTADISA